MRTDKDPVTPVREVVLSDKSLGELVSVVRQSFAGKRLQILEETVLGSLGYDSETKTTNRGDFRLESISEETVESGALFGLRNITDPVHPLDVPVLIGDTVRVYPDSVEIESRLQKPGESKVLVIEVARSSSAREKSIQEFYDSQISVNRLADMTGSIKLDWAKELSHFNNEFGSDIKLGEVLDYALCRVQYYRDEMKDDRAVNFHDRLASSIGNQIS